MKAKLITLITITLFITNSYATNYYWIGGAGNWSDINHWATASGGSVIQAVVPSPSDDVFFDGGSGFTVGSRTVTVNVTATCHNMTWAGALNTPTITGTNTNLLNIYGSLTLQNLMAYNVSSTYFKSNVLGETITTNGAILNSGAIYFDGAGGGWTMQDNFTTSNGTQVYLNQGTLNTNNRTLDIGSFGSGLTWTGSSNTPLIANLILGSSRITYRNAFYGWVFTGTGTTLNAGTSHILANTITSTQFSAYTGHSYYRVSGLAQVNANLNGTTVHASYFYENATINGNARFDTLLFSSGKKYIMGASSISTITAAFTATAAPCTGLIEIISGTSGTQSTLHFLGGSTASVNNSIIKDIRATGAIVPITATGSFDLGNNTGFTFTPPVANNLYWVGGLGNWNDKNHWSFSSGGAGGACIPTPADNVFFDGGSGFTAVSRIVTLDGVGQYCHNMTWAGALNTPTITGTNTNLLNIYGSLTLQNLMAYNVSSTYFKSNVLGETITTNGAILNSGAIYFDGAGGGWTMQDNFTTSNGTQVYLNQGTLNTNNRTLDIGSFGSGLSWTASSNTPLVANLILGSSRITYRNAFYGWIFTGTGTTLNAGTSHILANTITSTQFSAYTGHSYYRVSGLAQVNANLNGTTVHASYFYENATINGNARFDTLLFSSGKKYIMGASSISTITAAFTATAAPCTGLIEIISGTSGTQSTLHFLGGSTASVNNSIIKDIRATGAIVPITAVSSFDLGNNTGFTFTPPVANNLYWVGGLGNWNDKNHWSFSSGGAGGACIPTPADNVFFDGGSGFTAVSRIVTLDGVGQYCHNMTWAGALNTPTITGTNTNLLNIYGSLTLQNLMAYNVSSTYFKSNVLGETITTNGAILNSGAIYFDGAGGGWTMQDNFTTSNGTQVYLNQGTLNTNNRTLDIGSFGSGLSWTASSNTPLVANLILGSSRITYRNAFYGWIFTGTGTTLNAGTSHILANTITSTQFSAYTGHSYYRVSGLAQVNANLNGTTVHASYFYENATINGNAKFDTLLLSAGKTYILQAANTVTVTQQLYASGNPCYILFLKSSTTGTRANLKVQAGTINYDYSDIKDIDASPSYTALQMAGHSTNSGNNVNITFAPTLTTGIAGLGPDVAVGCNSFPYTLMTSGFYGTPGTAYTWFNGATTNTVAVGGVGNYSISVNYGAGCIVSDAIAVSAPAGQTVSATASTTLACSGSSITLTAGGVVSYTWSNGSTGSSIIVTPTANTVYTVTGTDGINCTNTKTVSISINTTPTVSIASVSNATICSGNSSTITPNGATNYTLTSSSTTLTSSPFVVNPTSSTTYSIIGSSVANCMAANTATSLITVSTTPTISTSGAVSATLCAGQSYTISGLSGGTGNYTLTNTGVTSATQFVVTPTITTTYSVIGANAGGCVSPASSDLNVTITISANPTITTSGATSATLCSGQSFTISPTGGTGTYTLTNTSATNTTSFVVIPSVTTTYTVIGANAGGCVSPAGSNLKVTITVNASPTLALSTVSSNTICSGQTVTFTPSGGASTYTLISNNSYTDTSSPYTDSPTTTSDYTLTGTAANGCVSNLSSQQFMTSVFVNASPTITSSGAMSATICSGQSYTISGLSGSGTGSYTLSPGNVISTTNFIVTPSVTTTYSIIGANASGCISTTSSDLNVTLTVNSSPTLVLTTVSSNTICSGQTVTWTPSGANTYTLTSATYTDTSSPYTHAPTSTTSYTLSGTNTVSGCVSLLSTQFFTNTITVNASPTLTASTVSSNTICSGQTVTFTPSGSATTYTLTSATYTDSSSPYTDVPLVTTNYTLSGTAANGCISSLALQQFTTSITVNATPTITTSGASSGTLCSGQSFTISPLAGSGTGSYTLTPGNFTTTTSFVVSPSVTTTYIINGTNTGGCLSTTSTDLNVAISINSTPTVVAVFSSNALCTSQNVTITLSGANGIYTLSPGTQTVTSPTNSFVISPSAGTTVYTITANNSNGCVSSLSNQIYTTSVSVVTNPTISVSAITNSICSGSTASITPFGASTFTLIPGNISVNSGQTFTLTPTAATTYTINGTATGGCVSIASTQFVTTIGINANPTVTAVSALGNTICTGLTTTLTASGATSYTWTGGPTTADYTVLPNATTVYTVIGENASGCSNSATPLTLTVNVLNSPTLALATTISTNTLCSGNSATITLGGASAGSTYSLFPGTATNTSSFVVNPTTTTDYTVIATDNANGCVSTTSVQLFTTTVTVATSPTIALSSIAPSTTLCSGQSVTITPTGGVAGSYTLVNTGTNPEPFVVTPSVTTTYTISGASSNGCISTASSDLVTTITVNQTPTVSLVSISPSQTLCSGQSATISVTGATNYMLQNTGSTILPFVITPSVTTTYTVLGINSGGCQSNNLTSLVTTITVGSGLSLATNVTSVSCYQGTNGQIVASVVSAGSVTYTWSTGSNAPVISGLSAGVYTLVVKSDNNCISTETVMVTQPSMISISDIELLPSCNNDATGLANIAITGGTPVYSVIWSNGEVGTVSNLLPVGIITATITDLNGCIENYQANIMEKQCIETFIPEVITPNGDGKNDVFFINSIAYFPENKLEIFNRWGNLLYVKEKYDNSFNGRANVSNSFGNGILPSGTYYIVFDFGDGITPVYKGFVELKY